MKTISPEEYKLMTAPPPRKLKYNNRPCEWNGMNFLSDKEMRHHHALWVRQQAGEIKDLRHEPEYQINVNGELICKIYPDHSWYEPDENGAWVWRLADTKSSATDTPYSMLKRKLFKAQFGVEIKIWK